MPYDLHRRLGLALFLAMSIAAAAGLSLLPAFDPVAGLRPLLGAGAGVLLVAAAAAGSQFSLRRLGVDARLAWVALGVATGVWLLGSLPGADPRSAADGRALLWLALTPLWLAVAGLGAQAGGASRPSARHSSAQTAG